MSDYLIECSSEEGITTALIEGLIATTRILNERDLSSEAVQEALKDMFGNSDLEAIRSKIQDTTV